jgi:hypothetical protein
MNLTWPLPVEMDDEALERLFYPPIADLRSVRAFPDLAYVHLELRRPGVTLVLLREAIRGHL